MNRNVNITRGGTFERITLRDTLLGAFLLWAGSVIVRVFAVTLFLLYVALFGRGFGPLALLFSFGQLRKKKFDAGKLARESQVFLALGFILSLAVIWGYWPAIFWSLGDGKLWVATARRSFSLPPVWLWLRVAFLAASPWIFVNPSRWLAWVLKMEQWLPKFRETMFKPGNPESVALPDGNVVAMATHMVKFAGSPPSADPAGEETENNYQITVKGDQ